MVGDLVRADERWQLRFRRELRHPVSKVWKALTKPEELRMWFPDTVHVAAWRVGEKMEFTDENQRIEPFDGEVLAYDPPRLLEFRWGTDIIRLEVEPRGDGSVLTLVDTIDELGKAARDGAGWHLCLDALERALEGSKSPGRDWESVRVEYVEKFGPEASTIGPPV